MVQARYGFNEPWGFFDLTLIGRIFRNDLFTELYCFKTRNEVGK
jgi:hypothetical protein